MTRLNALEPGPELDARLAALVGWEGYPALHEPSESYSDCECARCGKHCDWGKDFDGPCVPGFSTSMSWITRLAEEMREKGRIRGWSAYSWGWLNEGEPPSANVVRPDGVEREGEGRDVPHSLALALVAALEGQ